ncbi:hypothetical protein ACGFZR_24880 [Streptomyces sp. NPDC048241]|uniref:hypothetical protein n=1 Tax=Streptomyces sp. NPDC048241 TaxID=3365521 RepID=UPI00371F9CD0
MTTTQISILKQALAGAEDWMATARDRSLDEQERREAAQNADTTWHSIRTLAARLEEVCRQEAAALDPQLKALAPDDYSRKAIELDDLRRTWSDMADEMDALSVKAATNAHVEKSLDSEIHDIS